MGGGSAPLVSKVGGLKPPLPPPLLKGHDTQGRFFYSNIVYTQMAALVQLVTQSQASSSSQSFYITQNQGSISLIRQDGDPPPLGSYRCEVPDGAGSSQNLYIRIGETVLSMTLCVYALI